MAKQKNEYIKFILSMLIFGTNGIWVTHLSLTSAQIVFFRTLLGSIVLLIVVIATKQLSFKTLKDDFVPVLVSGLCVGANWVFLFESYKYASVSIGTLVYYCGPVLVMALSPVIFKEKLTRNKIIAIVFVITGMIFITGLSDISGSVRGILCACLAGLLYATLIISNKFIKKVDGINSTLYQLFISFLVICVYLVLKSEMPFEMPRGKELVYVLILGIVNSGLACWLYFSSMQKLPGQTVAICCYIDPLSALIFSAVFLDERMGVSQLIGAVLILSGAVIGELTLKKHNQQEVCE